jgi:polyphosphate kinase
VDQKYINKEISWLSFNERVLQEADNKNVPLIERMKFLGICSSNLDEFYRVRVATLNRLKLLGKKAKKLIGGDPGEILKQIVEISAAQHKKFDEIYNHILKEFAAENIHIIDETQLTEEQGQNVRNYLQETVRPKLFPLMLDQIKEAPELRDRMVYLAIQMSKQSDMRKARHALIEIPSDVLPRFYILPKSEGKISLILLDDIIRYGLDEIFSIFPYDKFEAWTIKITRDAELDIDDDFSESYIEKISKSLKQRSEGNPVRFIYDATMPPSFFDIITKLLQLTKNDTIIAGSKYHNNRDFMSFPQIGGKHLRYDPIKSLACSRFEAKKSIFSAIKEKDILLHYPYHTFAHVIDLLREASIDPKVTSIKLTVYRVAKNSSVLNALVNAARNGKSVVAMLELQARFDEASNIQWANRLQDAGVKVIFGIPGLKVHSKICLVTRQEKNKSVNYAIIGTGNFNEDTARLYTDHSLFTADKRLTKEVEKVFNFLSNTYITSHYKHLLVSPNYSRKSLTRLIKIETKNAEAGKDAWIFLKLNNLVDSQLIDLLYKASSAGVKIRLIIRGMFSLVPGIEKQSENIQAISIVDKFLEHSRIFIFANDGDSKYYISSADLMPRNLDRRIEVICPIYDDDIKEQLKNYMEIQWQDNTRARILSKENKNRYKRSGKSNRIRAQWEIYEQIKKSNC